MSNENAATETSPFEMYLSKFGRRFRLSKQDKAAGLSRDQAVMAALENGRELPPIATVSVADSVAKEVLADPTLTVDNFRERTGRRFRISTEQKSRGLTREQAFQEFIRENTK